jgi:Transposase IS66 family
MPSSSGFGAFGPACTRSSKIDPTRSAEVLIEVLGAEFNGVLGCDYFSAYRRYLREFDVSLQFCLAHLIRDVKFLTTLPDARDRMYGTRLREALRELFGVIHRREGPPAKEFQSQLETARAEVLRCGMHNVPATKHCRNLAKRFKERGWLRRGETRGFSSVSPRRNHLLPLVFGQVSCPPARLSFNELIAFPKRP